MRCACEGAHAVADRARQALGLYFDVHLPVKDVYAPPLNLRVFDNRKFGRKPLVGTTALKSLSPCAARGVGSGDADQRGVALADTCATSTRSARLQDKYYVDLAHKARAVRPSSG